jgi:hypothetical protein
MQFADQIFTGRGFCGPNETPVLLIDAFRQGDLPIGEAMRIYKAFFNEKLNNNWVSLKVESLAKKRRLINGRINTYGKLDHNAALARSIWARGHTGSNDDCYVLF